MATNFHLAPSPKTVDGLLAVPLDIESITGSFTFDGSASSGAADITIVYTVGHTAGNPIFDLRQNITQAWLDGSVFPINQLAHHPFGTGAFTDLRVIESIQAAGSVHTLRVQYTLALPNSQLGGSYLPVFDWSPGPRLRFVFGLSDLNRARYAEAWLPANLLFDQYSINLEVEIINTLAAHSLITNGTATPVGANHWQVSFPARFSALSPLLEVRATDTLVQQSDTVLLPVSGVTVTIEAWAMISSAVNLTTQINTIKTLLIDNENDYGPYLHGNRYVAFFNDGGMEYEGGTTTSSGALSHETFHSWYARGIKPASQADGWWDEGFTTFHDEGANDAIPFDFSDAPVLLCSRDPWQRHTPGNSYTDGAKFCKGMASLLGISTFNTLMGDLYKKHKGNPVSTQMIEEFLLSRSGKPEVVDAFHRFVYGLQTPSPAPDVWIKDDPTHSGTDAWAGAFWDSPDLWIRNADDDGTTHQSPEYGQDNWFYARVRNRSATTTAQHFVVTFHSRGFAGTQFVYPADFLPALAAKAEFDLPAGGTRIVKACWDRVLVPPAGTHTCLLAAVFTRSDHPTSAQHVWEHNNLAQKNLTIVNLQPDMFFILPVVLSNWWLGLDPMFELAVLTKDKRIIADISLIHHSHEFFRLANTPVKRFEPKLTRKPGLSHQELLDCGGHIANETHNTGRLLTSDVPEIVMRRFPDSWEAPFLHKLNGTMPVEIPQFTQKAVGLKLHIPAKAKPGHSLKLHFVQRHVATQQIVGGVAVQVNINRTRE